MTPESVDVGGVRRVVLECRDDVIVRPNRGDRCNAWRSAGCSRVGFPRSLLAVARVPLHAGSGVSALKVADEDAMQLRPVIDVSAGQVLEPCPRRVTEVEQQVLDDEEVICRPTRVACESLVLQPHAGVSIPVVSRDVGRSPETREELGVPHVLSKGPQTPLV
jgi:hypothetical protein